MKNTINSPIFITILAIIALFILQNRSQNRVATELRSTYEELLSILEDGSSDFEKTKAIQTFANEIGTQLRTGFQSGFASDETKKEDSPEKIFLEQRPKISVSEPTLSPADKSNRQEILYSVTNTSDQPIKQLKVNIEYYREGKLVDLDNNWISEAKVLAPAETLALKDGRMLPRDLPEDQQEAAVADEVRIKVTSFDIVK